MQRPETSRIDDGVARGLLLRDTTDFLRLLIDVRAERAERVRGDRLAEGEGAREARPFPA